MYENMFRKIGFSYVVISFICSVAGAIYCFATIVESKTVCLEYLCESGFGKFLVSVISMIMCLMSATFSIFVKLGIEEGESGYIHISRAFMLVRSLVLTVRLTYESVSLILTEINEEASSEVIRFQNIKTLLLIVITAVTGVELWILDNAQKYTRQRLRDDTVSNRS